MAIFPANLAGDYDEYPDRDSGQEEGDCHYGKDTGHDGLQHFRPAEFLPRVPLF